MRQIPIHISLLAILVLGFTSCKEKLAAEEKKSAFCLTDSLQKKIIIDTVQAQRVKSSISLSGKIEADADKVVKVFPVVGGVVQEMKVQLGDYVTKGQALAVIRSGEIADFQGQLTYAQSSIRNAEKNLSSVRDMNKSGLATDKDVVSAETDLAKARADLRKMEQTINIYGGKGNAIQTITAPISGYVIEKNVTDKMQFKIDGTQPFFVIANLDEVWVMANVFESEIANVKLGYDADIHVIAYPDKQFTGKVDRIFSILDPESKVMKVRIRIQNKEKLLKPEMFTQVNLKYDDGSNELPAIPSAAIIFDKNKNFVMVYHDKCNIETREIETEESIGNTTYIKAGLKKGEQVIAQYQLLVYDAMND